jgi:hypothetical protein
MNTGSIGRSMNRKRSVSRKTYHIKAANNNHKELRAQLLIKL